MEEGVDVDKYFDICEAMGVEPKEEDIPISYGDLAYEVQDALSIFNLLPARIAEFSGTYLGRDLGNLSFFFDMYEIEDKSWRQFYLRIILAFDSAYVDINDKKRKAKESTSKRKPGTISHG